MNNERREPNVGHLEEFSTSDRIPTLTDIATPGDPAGAGQDAPPLPATDAVPEPSADREPRTPELFGEPAATAPPTGQSTPTYETADAGTGEDSEEPRIDFGEYDAFVSEIARLDEEAKRRMTAPVEQDVPADEEPGASIDSTAEPRARAAEEPRPDLTEEDIEALADRVLDQVAPVLREAVTAAIEELLARRTPPAEQ